MGILTLFGSKLPQMKTAFFVIHLVQERIDHYLNFSEFSNKLEKIALQFLTGIEPMTIGTLVRCPLTTEL